VLFQDEHRRLRKSTLSFKRFQSLKKALAEDIIIRRSNIRTNEEKLEKNSLRVKDEPRREQNYED